MLVWHKLGFRWVRPRNNFGVLSVFTLPVGFKSVLLAVPPENMSTGSARVRANAMGIPNHRGDEPESLTVIHVLLCKSSSHLPP